MTEPLKPCPFCGSDDVSDAGYIYSGKKDAPKEEGFFCNCVKCGAKNGGVIGYATKKDARDAWNTRPASPAPVWRDISTAPKDGTVIFVWLPDTFKHMGTINQDCIRRAQWLVELDEWRIEGRGGNIPAKPTHWMPLPAAPGSQPTEQPPQGTPLRDDRQVAELIEYLDLEATHEVECEGQLTDFAKKLRRLETTARKLAREAGYSV